jgi:hypothetical protein
LYVIRQRRETGEVKPRQTQTSSITEDQEGRRGADCRTLALLNS